MEYLPKSLMTTKQGRAILLVALLALAQCSSLPVLAQAVNSVEHFNREILLKEIELERYAIEFRKRNNVQGRWRGWRYFLSQEANAAATGAGLISQIGERQRIINVPNEMVLGSNGQVTYKSRPTNRAKLESGLYPQMIGQIIGATGSGVELGINMYHGYQARKAGFSPKEGKAKALSLRNEIEALFAERKKAVLFANLSKEDLAIADAEEVVLRDLTEMGLDEYVNFHVGARRFRTFQDTLYIMDVAKNTLGAVGNLVNIVGFHENKPHYSGPGGLLTALSGLFIIGTPLVSRAAGKIVGDINRRSLKSVSDGQETRDIEKLEHHREHLVKLLESKPGFTGPQSCSAQTLAILSSYEKQTALKRNQFDLATREIRSGTRAATENVLVGTMVGGSKISLGVGVAIAGFRYARNNHRGNSVAQPGTIAYAAGSFLTVEENLRMRILDEIQRAKLSKARQLPMQVLGDRLKALDEMETSLKTCSKGQP